MLSCPTCAAELPWDSGGPYEEPTHTLTDRERLYRVLLKANSVDTTSKLTNLLIENGVTFREG